MMSMTYQNCKKLIERGRFVKEEMLEMLDVFLMGKRLTEKEYKELVTMTEATNE